jgi:hypothetical protein
MSRAIGVRGLFADGRSIVCKRLEVKVSCDEARAQENTASPTAHCRETPPPQLLQVGEGFFAVGRLEIGSHQLELFLLPLGGCFKRFIPLAELRDVFRVFYGTFEFLLDRRDLGVGQVGTRL